MAYMSEEGYQKLVAGIGGTSEDCGCYCRST